MGDIPRLVLSVRQPWASAIVFAGKDIEGIALTAPLCEFGARRWVKQAFVRKR